MVLVNPAAPIGPRVQARRFVREAALLAQLAHPGIVEYVAHGTTDGEVPYLCMEWLDGLSLADRLAQKPLSM